MGNKTHSPTTPAIPAVSHLAVAILDLGKTIHDLQPPHSFRTGSKVSAAPDEVPSTELLKKTAAARRLITFRDGAPDPIELRVFAVTAYLHVMMDQWPNTRWIVELVGSENCKQVLQARQALHRLALNGAVVLRDTPEKQFNCLVSLSGASAMLLDLCRKESPILFSNKSMKGSPADTPDTGTPPDPLATIPTVHELAAKVGTTVLGMPETVACLSAHMVMHMRRARLIRDGKDCPPLGNTCICLIGDSGTGKTFVIHELGKATGLPFGSSAATDYSVTAFVGLNSEDALKPVLSAAGNNPALARHGICHLDEWDKLRPVDSSGSTHVSTTGVVHSFLRLMEGSEVICNAKRSSAFHEQACTVSTVGTAFAFSGVFKGLREELKPNVRQAIGFDAGDRSPGGRMLQDAMVSWGMPREWVNRLSLIRFMPPMTIGLLMEAAVAGNGVIAAYNKLLEPDGKSFTLTDAAVRELAGHALESKGYVRAVKMAVARCCELVLGGDKKGRTEFDPAGIREVIASMAGDCG